MTDPAACRSRPSGRLSTPDRYLTLWIFAAMALGVALGNVAPAPVRGLAGLSSGTTSLPIALGPILVRYPPPARVRDEMGAIAAGVLVDPGIPFVAGVPTGLALVRLRGRAWSEGRSLPAIGPITVVALLWSIVAVSSPQGRQIVRVPLDAARIAAPLLVDFAAMFLASFWMGRKPGAGYPKAATPSFAAASWPSPWRRRSSASTRARPSPRSSARASRCPS